MSHHIDSYIICRLEERMFGFSAVSFSMDLSNNRTEARTYTGLLRVDAENYLTLRRVD